jgi:spore germination cell wall hydrolase CwlJ-like protein
MKNTLFSLLLRSVIVSLSITFLSIFGLKVTWAKELVQTRSIGTDQSTQATASTLSADSVSSGQESSQNDKVEEEVHCLALNIYFEARGETEMGQRAVGHVVMNRVAHTGYPSTVCAVVRQGGEKKRHRCQFSWWCDGQSDKPGNQTAWDQSLRIARQIYAGTLRDITDGALWYHATYVTPYWSKVLLQGDKIGQHIFYLEHRQANNAL